MNGKVCLITGATGGIGRETALALAKQGATVVGVGRNPQKCADTAGVIKQLSGNPQVEFLVADLSVQAQIRKLAEEFKRRYHRLDVLINNAGAIFWQRRESADGIEMTLALNHLNYFLLTALLRDVLVASGPARVVNVASRAERGGKINFDDMELKQGYSAMRAYGQSKLANIMFTYALARRLAGTEVTANALHPGFVASGFARNNGPLFDWGMRIIGRVGGITPERGAQTSIYLASSPEVEGVTGKYYSDCRPTRSQPASYDEAAQERLWALSEAMTGVRAPT